MFTTQQNLVDIVNIDNDNTNSLEKDDNRNNHNYNALELKMQSSFGPENNENEYNNYNTNLIPPMIQSEGVQSIKHQKDKPMINYQPIPNLSYHNNHTGYQYNEYYDQNRNNHDNNCNVNEGENSLSQQMIQPMTNFDNLSFNELNYGTTISNKNYTNNHNEIGKHNQGNYVDNIRNELCTSGQTTYVTQNVQFHGNTFYNYHHHHGQCAHNHNINDGYYAYGNHQHVNNMDNNNMSNNNYWNNNNRMNSFVEPPRSFQSMSNFLNPQTRIHTQLLTNSRNALHRRQRIESSIRSIPKQSNLP